MNRRQQNKHAKREMSEHAPHEADDLDIIRSEGEGMTLVNPPRPTRLKMFHIGAQVRADKMMRAANDTFEHPDVRAALLVAGVGAVAGTIATLFKVRMLPALGVAAGASLAAAVAVSLTRDSEHAQTQN